MAVTFVSSKYLINKLINFSFPNYDPFLFRIAKVRTFNRNCPVPDALLGSHHMGGSVGLTQRGADMAELFEKQADLISYLKDHNLRLNQKLMQLNAHVRTVAMHQ